MRSRFAAFALSKVGYLWHTLHRDHDEKRGDAKQYTERLRSGLKGLVYKELVVFDCDGPDAEGVARVLFKASVLSKGQDASFVELSSFANDGEGWRYLFGIPVEAKQIQSDTSAMTIARATV